MDKEKLRSELERRLAEMKPRLKPTDRVRWLWGYADADKIVDAYGLQPKDDKVVFSALHSGIYYLQYDKRKQRYKLVRILGSQIKIIDDGNLYHFEFKIRHKEVYVGVFNYRHAWFLDAQSAIERMEANNGDQGI